MPERSEYLFSWRPISRVRVGDILLINSLRDLVQVYGVRSYGSGQIILSYRVLWEGKRREKLFNGNTEVLYSSSTTEPSVIAASWVSLGNRLIYGSEALEVTRVDGVMESGIQSITFTLNQERHWPKHDFNRITTTLVGTQAATILRENREMPDNLSDVAHLKIGDCIRIPWDEDDKRRRSKLGAWRCRGFFTGKVIGIHCNSSICSLELDNGSGLSETIKLHVDMLVEIVSSADLPMRRRESAKGHLNVEVLLD